jgi:cysteinyl-tRNA synthetase
VIRLYDTGTREKRPFEPADPKRITMYVCGPTVYGRAHIGNARPAVVFDTLRRLLRHQYGTGSVVYARNITDVDDKIIDAAREEGVEPEVITARYEQAYLDDMRALGVEDPDIAPHATAETGPMIAMIGELIAQGHAYAAEGHVLFDVGSDPNYGVLSRRDREAMLAGARVEVAPYKRAPGDFVLWKPSAPEVIGWDSPWGRGRPGWHIECSAMIRAHLGETIDIHGGGIDLVFPHHENEAAQSRCAHGGAPLARHWVHNGFVDFGSEKMSKSLGNTVLVNELLDEGHRGEVLRLALLSAHYRSPLPWTQSRLVEANSTFETWKRRFGNAFESAGSIRLALQDLGAPDERAAEALRDDLNTPAAFEVCHRLAEDSLHASGRERRAEAGRLLGATARLLGVDLGSTFLGSVDEVRVNLLIEQRSVAKQARDFARADGIRDDLKTEGILLEDGPGGTTWRRA